MQEVANKGILCQASEKGKIIINKCINKDLFINTLKMEKLLILVHGNMLAQYNKPFFNENVVTYGRGLIIEEVDRDFLEGAVFFNKRYTEYVTLLDKEEEMVDRIIKLYGSLRVYDLNQLSFLKKIEDKYATSNMKSIISNEAIKEAFTLFPQYKKELRTIKIKS